MLDVSYIGNHGSRLNHQLAPRGPRLQHERPERPGARRRGPAMRTSIRRPRGTPGSPPLSGLQRKRRPGAAEVSAVPEHRVAGLPPGGSQYHALEVVLEQHFSQGSSPASATPTPRLKNNGAESGPGQRGSTTAASRIPSWDTLDSGSEPRRHAARAAGRASPGTCPGTRTGRARRRPSSAAGTLRASCATRAAGRCTSPWPTTWAACSSTRRNGPTATGERRDGARRFRPGTDNYFNRDGLDGPGSAHVRQRAANRRDGARLQGFTTRT